MPKLPTVCARVVRALSRTFSCLLLSAALGGVLLSLQPASARILLKPSGQNAMPLRTRSLTADTTIDRQFATTQLTLTFQNEIARRVEADFIYTLPPDTVVTYFAYWFGEEKVVARVVEKERAAAIYQHITSRLRDPALIELIGKDTFRARIFPVMPNSDLKVEMRLVQVLPSDQMGVFYEFPLLEEKKPTTALDSVNLSVHVKADASIKEVTNNYGLPVRKDGDGYRITLSGTNYRPSKDLRIRLVRKVQPLHAALYAAPSGGRDGFFALALTPDHSLVKPRLNIRGVTTYHVVPTRLPAVKAHHTLTLCGRYRGSGRATVTLAGTSPNGRLTYSATVRFGAKREPNNLATKLWAARRMEQLGASAANRSTVIWLSKRFTLPSKFTSWLAVPKAEMERYRREKEEEVKWRLRRKMSAVAYELVKERHSAKPNAARIASLRRELNRLARAVGEPAEGYINASEHFWTEREVQALRNELAAQLSRDAPNTQKVRQLGKRFIALSRKPFPREKPETRADLSQSLLEFQAKLDELCREMDAARRQGSSLESVELQKRRTELLKVLNVAWRTTYRLRIGDPLISISAPADAAQVVALLPHGEVKRLAWNPDTGRWEARFDIPTYTAEGEYVITVIIVLKDGTRRMLTLRYRVDVTPPGGVGQARMVRATTPTLRLELDASEDTARVVALLPWNERVELKPSTQQPHRFFALVPVPPAHQGSAFAVTFVLTDRAHNRMTVTVDAAKE